MASTWFGRQPLVVCALSSNASDDARDQRAVGANSIDEFNLGLTAKINTITT
jgi:hypothetical protein